MPSSESMPPKNTGLSKSALIGISSSVLAVIVLLFLYWIRPFSLIRGPFMLVYRHPALFTIPFFLALIGGAIHVIIKMTAGDKYKKAPRESRFNSFRYNRDYPRATGTFITWAVCGLVGLLIAAIFTGAWTARSIYSNTSYGKLTTAMLEGSQVRVKPFDVAENQIDASLNSPTDHATHFSILKVNGKLTWTAVRDPEGTWRSFSHGSDGLIAVPASASAPEEPVGSKLSSKETLGTFKYSPGSKLSKNFGWHAHKICYTCDIAEVIAIPTANGPVIAAPFVKWEGGWITKHPVFSGVFLEEANGGSFKMLNVKEAEANPVLVASGHIFPDGLALRIAEAYAYKNGISNRLFSHKEQLDVEQNGEESNEQPYLEDFAKLGMQWVTTLKPTGSTFTTAAIITTSALNGQTRIWKTGNSSTLIGGSKAIEIVRGQPGLGVTFAAAGAEDSSGKFLAIEPRQVFPPGQGLQYLISVVPSAETRVSLNVVVDAETQSVVAVFQTDAAGDADLVNYLSTGKLPASEQFNGSGAGNQTGLSSTPTEGETSPEPTAPTAPITGPAVGLPTGAGAVATIERLLAENKASAATDSGQLKALKAEQKDLERLLTAAKKTPTK